MTEHADGVGASLPPDEGRGPAPAPGRSRRHRVRLVLGVLLCLLLLVLAYQAARTALALRAAKADASMLRSQLGDGDVAAGRVTARDLRHQARVAHDQSDGVLWDALAAVPLLGDNVDSVQRLAAALDEAAGAVGPAVTLYDELGQGGLRSSDGRVDLARLASLRPDLTTMAATLTRAERHVDPIRPDGLLPGLSSQVRSAVEDLRGVAAAARAGVVATRIAPAMLGADGPRTYLLVAQNNAEVRATGGLPGSLSLLHAQDGRISLGAQLSVGDFKSITRPVAVQSAQEKALYNLTPASDVRDFTTVPDWPTVSSRLRAIVARDRGQQLDGVISIDPVTVAEVLRATGPVSGPGGEQITGDNALAKLLNEPYQRFATDAQQNAFFATTARAVFNRFATGELTPSLLSALAGGVDQRRVLVWSAHPDEQAELDGSAIAGGLPTGRTASPQVGLYLNDATAGKIEYYLRYHTALASQGCSGGRQQLRASMVLTSHAPRDPSTLSKWVYGFGDHAPRGWMKMLLRVYAPTGGSVTRVEANGRAVSAEPLTHEGRQVSTITLLMKPGGQVRLDVDLQGPRGATADPRLEWTPSMTWGPTETTAPSACS